MHVSQNFLMENLGHHHISRCSELKIEKGKKRKQVQTQMKFFMSI